MEISILEAAAELFAVNAELKALEEKAKSLKETMKAIGSFTDGGYAVSVKSSSRTNINPSLLKEKYPTIAEEISYTTDVISVSVKKV